MEIGPEEKVGDLMSRLAEIGDWMEINGEAIYGTRPFRVFGEGENVRFTRAKDGGAIFVIALEWPGVDLTVASLNSRDLPLDPGTQVTLLGHSGDLNWVQDRDALRIEMPPGAREAGPDAWVVKVGSVPMAREGG